LPLLLSSRHAELRWRSAELIATLTQNNPYCQNAVLEVKLLPLLVKLLDSALEDEQVRIKALYAVSCKLFILSSVIDFTLAIANNHYTP